MRPIEPIPLEAIRAARQRIAGSVLHTPLIRLNVDDAPCHVFLKLENLQPIGSFKLRGASNAMKLADASALENGVYTASAGNMAQGVAYNARRLGIACSVVVPEHAPRTKLDAIERLGATIIQEPFDVWWKVITGHRYDGLEGLFIHPVSDPAVIAGNGTIGLEILEDLPEVDTVLIPFGGGGLSCGIASAIKVLKPETNIYACEVASAAPLSASLRAGCPQTIDYQKSFVDGIGGMCVLETMWPMIRRLIDDSIVMPLDAVADAIRLLIDRNRVIAEGAGACSVAAALSGRAGQGNVVCVVSGGNIDSTKLTTILQGRCPE